MSHRCGSTEPFGGTKRLSLENVLGLGARCLSLLTPPHPGLVVRRLTPPTVLPPPWGDPFSFLLTIKLLVEAFVARSLVLHGDVAWPDKR